MAPRYASVLPSFFHFQKDPPNSILIPFRIQVFKKRSYPLLYFYWSIVLVGLLRGPSIPFILGALVLTYMYMELYGAVLHIVLDNPTFLNLPVIGEPCLEFQMHHFIPHEITVRKYADICGDLNVIVSILFAIHMLLYDGLKDGRVMCVVAAGGANAYFGQWAHRQAHMLPNARHPVAVKLQEWGVMVSPDLHRAHHRTYDRGFAILAGWSECIMTPLFSLISQWIWLALFAAMTVGGIACCVELYLPLYDYLAGQVAVHLV